MLKRNKQKALSHSVKLVSSALLLSAATGAAAQGTLEEVVVTAQKRAQSLQDTPIAITAFSERDLEQKGIRNVTDLGTFSPNVKITPLPSNTASTTIAIRGSVTSNPAPTWEPTVGLYLDGTYIGKFSGNTFKIADLERVEVLRGPQGTLYGKNTIGGAINLITRQPTGEFGGTVRAGVGNYGFWEVYGSLDLPALQMGALGELKAKVSYITDERDGFYESKPATQGAISHPFGGTIEPNQNGSKDHNATNGDVARLDLLWEISDRFSLRYVFDHADVRNTPAKTQLTNVDPDDFTFQVNFPADLNKYVIDDDKNASKNSSDADIFEDFRSDNHSLFANYELGNLGALGDVAVKYIFNNRDLDFEQSLDNDGTPFSIFHTSLHTLYEQTSHEIQITGSTERVNYVLGLFHFKEEVDADNPWHVLNDFFGEAVINNYYGLEAKQIAAYGQVDWRPSAAVLEDRLTLTAGLRWTKEEKDSYINHPDDTNPDFSPNPWAAEADKTWTNLAPTLIANWEFNDSLSGYVKYSKGWKSGGFNGESPSAEAFVSGYDPEEVDAFEVGIKSRWLDNTLQFNAAAFYNKEKDLQLSVFTPAASGAPVSAVRNAGEAVKQGFEFEVLYQPIADVQLSLNYGYLDTEYQEYMEFDENVGMDVDKKDEKAFQYAPRHTVNVGAEYTFLRGGWGELTARLDYTYNDKFVAYVNPDQNASLGGHFDGYGLFNGRLTLGNIPVGRDATMQVALWGKNLTDEDYRLNGIPFGPFATSFYGDPRTYGLEATLHF